MLDNPAKLSDKIASPAERRPAAVEYPCSFGQERFWLLDRLEPGNASYNVAVRWRLKGRVSKSTLEQSWSKLIERHEILRTVFLERDGPPVQRVLPNSPVHLHEIDLSVLPVDERETEAVRIGYSEAAASFDLSDGPLLRLTLLRLDASESILLITTHQIVSDGWSIGVMAREMGLIYQALRQNKPVPLEPLAIQYSDFTRWQLEWLRVRGTDAEAHYWSRQLAGIKPFRVTPDLIRPTVPSAKGAIASRVLPRGLTTQTQAMSADLGTTLFSTMVATLSATLVRFTGDAAVVIGTQVSDRDQIELEPMIGQFVRSLILRIDASGDPTVTALIERTRATVEGALEHRNIPIERLLGMIKSERSYASSPPVSVNFIFQKSFIQNTSYGEFDLIDMPSLPAGAIYDLNFFMVERFDGWRLSCQYHTEQFLEATVERLLAYFENVLASAVGNKELHLSELALCAPGEAQSLLDGLNDTRRAYPRDLTLAALFELQVRRAPEAIAVICGERTCSYAELNDAAEALAERLRDHGIATSTRVAVCLPPSCERVTAELAVLKAGATFVSIDANDPAPRQAEIVNAAAASVLLGRRTERLAEVSSSVVVIDIDDVSRGDTQREGLSAAQSAADAPAALAVTAATTAGVKLVALSHRTLTNVIYSIARHPGITERNVVVATSPAGTDGEIFETFLALLVGASLVVPDEATLSNGTALLSLLQRRRATVMYGSRGVWTRLLDAGWSGDPALKMFGVASALGARLVDKLAQLSGELWTLYGHTETGVWSAVERQTQARANPRLGRPLANTELFVLDDRQRMAPVGATGTIYVTSDGIIDAGARTAPDPRGDSRATLYSTGDAGRLTADGQIEYLGKRNRLISVRGQSVNPAEIESAILRHAHVVEAFVLPAGNNGHETALTAHVALDQRLSDPHAIAEFAAGVRSHLATLLPRHLIPAEIVVHERLPRLADAAVDVLAIASAGSSRSQPSTLRQSDEIQASLSELWRSMLELDAVGPRDNFFELGGHSLLAARMLTQVERQFGRRIKLSMLFAAPTLERFAALVAHEDSRNFDFREIVRVQSAGSRKPIIAINNTGNYYLVAKGLGADQPFISLQLFDPAVKSERMPEKLEDVAAGYVKLIRRVQPAGPYTVMGWCVAGALTFEIARQLTRLNQRVDHVFLMDSWVPRYIERQPILRRILGGYSLRWQLIRLDWRRMRAGRKTLAQFFSSRATTHKLRRLWRGPDPAPSFDSADETTPDFSREAYDAWLLKYLQSLVNDYEPSSYEGKVTLFRSAIEPTGWFFDPGAGWGRYAKRGVDLYTVPGDHHTMFQSPGAGQIAERIAVLTSAGR